MTYARFHIAVATSRPGKLTGFTICTEEDGLTLCARTSLTEEAPGDIEARLKRQGHERVTVRPFNSKPHRRNYTGSEKVAT